MRPEMHLVDDGTMDTVLLCSDCGEEFRYSEADRDESGAVLESWLAEKEEEHSAECDHWQDIG